MKTVSNRMWKKCKQWLQKISTYPSRRNSISFKERTVTVKEKTYCIRQIEETDIKALLEIEREVYYGEVPWNYSAFRYELNSFIPHLYLLIETSESPCFVVGFIGCRFSQGNAHVTNVVIRKAFQGLGLGSYLIEEVKNVAFLEGCLTMSLEVRMSNQLAQSVYRKSGFV